MASCKAAYYSYRSTISFIKRIMTWLRHRKSARLLRKKSNDDDDNFRRILIEHYCYYYYLLLLLLWQYKTSGCPGRKHDGWTA